MTIYDESLQQHAKYKGKLAVASKVPLNSKEDLSVYYSPGVAQPCLEIAKDPAKAYEYTWKCNSVAVVSDGTAVLGLGNIWWLASLPVMEGKSVLFKHFWDVDAIPIVLDTQNPDEIIETVTHIAPTFGGINLEDIAAPNCFIIEEALKARLNIPVFHDDQHGTAIVVLAGLMNALKVVGKSLESVKIVVSWAGAAGIACVKLLATAGATHIVTLDSKGALIEWRADMNSYKTSISYLNINQETGNLNSVIAGADVFVWVSQPNILTAQDVKTMNNQPIVFALSNPNPEITPEEAKLWWAAIIATGRSDYPNQINNILAFPGIFKGVLRARIRTITDEHKLAAAHALAALIATPTVDRILPGPLEAGIAEHVAQAVESIK